MRILNILRLFNNQTINSFCDLTLSLNVNRFLGALKMATKIELFSLLTFVHLYFQIVFRTKSQNDQFLKLKQQNMKNRKRKGRETKDLDFPNDFVQNLVIFLVSPALMDHIFCFSQLYLSHLQFFCTFRCYFFGQFKSAVKKKSLGRATLTEPNHKAVVFTAFIAFVTFEF